MIDRRSFLGLSSGMVFGSLWAQALQNSHEEHYFLQIYIAEGVDATYLFDARPRNFTEAGKVHSYYPAGDEPFAWQDRRGKKTWAAPAVKSLEGFKDYFSILNGVHMETSFAGHEQNANYLFTGNAFGGSYFLPTQGRAPLDFVSDAQLFGIQMNNRSKSVNMSPKTGLQLAQLASLARSRQQPGQAIVAARVAANAATHPEGQFSQGVEHMQQGLIKKNELVQLLAKVGYETRSANDDDAIVKFENDLHMFASLFRENVTHHGLIEINLDLDTHDPQSAAAQPEKYANLSSHLSRMLEFLRTTPARTPGKSLLDVTTFVVASEFGRTFRQANKAIDATGTDHNTTANTVLIGGKGIQSGLVLGATDLDQLDSNGEFANVSPLHQSLDRVLVAPMGQPFDFASGESLTSMPQAYDPALFLSFNNIINSLAELFGATEQKRQVARRPGSPLAATLRQLLV